MSRNRLGWCWCAAVAIVSAFTVGPGLDSGASAQAPVRAEPGAERMREMKGLAGTVTVLESNATAARPIGPERDPSVRYADPPRHIEDATLWLFRRRGRPLAAMKIEIYPKGLGLYGLVSLCPATIAAKAEDGWRWDSTRPGLVMAPIPAAPAPAGSARERLAQMKVLSRRFSGAEDDGPGQGKLALRLLPKPIDRYADPGAGLLDGAIFSLATGTNPDILLVIEAAPAGAAPPVWRYGIARVGGAELSASLDGRVVWTETPAAIPSRLATYANRYVHRDDQAP